MVSAPAMTIARMIGDGLEKGFVSWWFGMRKNLEYHAGFTHYQKYMVGHVFLLLALLLVLSIIDTDAQDKWLPHLPFQFEHPTTDALRESIACAETRRRSVLEDKIKSEAALSGYKQCVAANLGIDEKDVQRFDGTADGSLVAYVDYVYSAATAMFGTVYFWYLFWLFMDSGLVGYFAQIHLPSKPAGHCITYCCC